MLRYLFGLAITVFLGSALHAGGRATEPAMNPVRHASRSGDVVLFMDPTDSKGRGQASYALPGRARFTTSAIQAACSLVASQSEVPQIASTRGGTGCSE